MRMRTMRRGGAIGVAVVALVICAMPASAAPGDGSAYAVEVAVTVPGEPGARVGPLARSSTSGPTTAIVPTVHASGIVTSGAAASSATLDQDTGIPHAQADLADVGIGLAALTGRIGAVNASCDATQAGVKGATTLANVRLPGVRVPANPGRNHVVDLRAAKIVFNEQTENGNGGLTVNAVHIYLHRSAGRGNIVLSSARCGPACPPVPLASGLGLWLGLGLLAIPAAVAVRKRRAA